MSIKDKYTNYDLNRLINGLLYNWFYRTPRGCEKFFNSLNYNLFNITGKGWADNKAIIITLGGTVIKYGTVHIVLETKDSDRLISLIRENGEFTEFVGSKVFIKGTNRKHMVEYIYKNIFKD